MEKGSTESDTRGNPQPSDAAEEEKPSKEVNANSDREPTTATSATQPIPRAGSTAPQGMMMEDIIQELSQDEDLIRIVEQGLTNILNARATDDRKQASIPNSSSFESNSSLRDEVTQRVLRKLLDDKRNVRTNPPPPSDTISQQFRSPPGPAANLGRTPYFSSTLPVSTTSSRLKSPSRGSARSRSRSPSSACNAGAVTSLADYGGATNANLQSNTQTAPPPVKSVSFSSISVPDLDLMEEETRRPSTPPRNGHPQTPPSLSPPPPLSPPRGNARNNVTGTNHHHNTPAVPLRRYHRTAQGSTGHFSPISTGETTASGESSAAVSGTTTPLTSSSLPAHHVHFSAMNPNPQLILDAPVIMDQSAAPSEDQNDANSNATGTRVSFTLNRSVSWDDENTRMNNRSSGRSSGRSSRSSGRQQGSGMSSPSIEPALSPPLSRGGSRGVQINLSAMEIITEAAERLRRSVEQEPTSEDGAAAFPRITPRLVHFSSMRGVTVVNTEDCAAASSFSNEGAIQREGEPPQPTVHFADEVLPSSEQTSLLSTDLLNAQDDDDHQEDTENEDQCDEEDDHQHQEDNNDPDNQDGAQDENHDQTPPPDNDNDNNNDQEDNNDPDNQDGAQDENHDQTPPPDNDNDNNNNNDNDRQYEGKGEKRGDDRHPPPSDQNSDQTHRLSDVTPAIILMEPPPKKDSQQGSVTPWSYEIPITYSNAFDEDSVSSVSEVWRNTGKKQTDDDLDIRINTDTVSHDEQNSHRQEEDRDDSHLNEKRNTSGIIQYNGSPAAEGQGMVGLLDEFIASMYHMKHMTESVFSRGSLCSAAACRGDLSSNCGERQQMNELLDRSIPPEIVRKLSLALSHDDREMEEMKNTVARNMAFPALSESPNAGSLMGRLDPVRSTDSASKGDANESRTHESECATDTSVQVGTTDVFDFSDLATSLRRARHQNGTHFSSYPMEEKKGAVDHAGGEKHHYDLRKYNGSEEVTSDTDTHSTTKPSDDEPHLSDDAWSPRVPGFFSINEVISEDTLLKHDSNYRESMQNGTMRNVYNYPASCMIPLRPAYHQHAPSSLSIISNDASSTFRRVQFSESIVSEIRERPRTKEEDVRALFYSESDLDEFERDLEEEEMGVCSIRSVSPRILRDENGRPVMPDSPGGPQACKFLVEEFRNLVEESPVHSNHHNGNHHNGNLIQSGGSTTENDLMDAYDGDNFGTTNQSCKFWN